MNKNRNYWGKKHLKYDLQGISKKPSKLILALRGYLTRGDKVLEIGCGNGQDANYIEGMGCDVTALDLNIDFIKDKYASNSSINFLEYDITNGLDLVSGEKYDVVYSSMSLHYFTSKETTKIFDDIYKILKNGGRFICMLNSKNDPEFNQGIEIEEDYFLIDGIKKRFFSTDTLKSYVNKFNIILLDDQGSSWKDDLKGVGSMIRFVGIK